MKLYQLANIVALTACVAAYRLSDTGEWARAAAPWAIGYCGGVLVCELCHALDRWIDARRAREVKS